MTIGLLMMFRSSQFLAAIGRPHLQIHQLAIFLSSGDARTSHQAGITARKQHQQRIRSPVLRW